MVVLHIYGKISPICISKKLGLYISNLPEEEDNNWKEDLEQELQYMETIDELDRARLGMIDVFESIYEIRKKQRWIGAFSPMIQLLSIKSMATF